MEAQHSIEWFRKRIGMITGSQCGLLMKSGRKDYFSDTGKSYILQIAAERAMNPTIVDSDELFSVYLQQVNVNSKAMQWGTDQEANARSLYEKITGRHPVEVGSCVHPTIQHFSSSPDGFYFDEESGDKLCLEIKCPSQKEFMRYKSEVKDSDSLLSTKYEYFYQCMAHMMVTGAKATDFIAYCPFQSNPIHIIRVEADESVFAEMEKRINAANDIINDLIG